MNTEYMDLNAESIDEEHICCAFSDKKVKGMAMPCFNPSWRTQNVREKAAWYPW